MDEHAQSQIEQRLYTLKGPVNKNQDDIVVGLIVLPNSGWVIKIRRGIIIVNDKDLICEEYIDYDGTITFDNHEAFWKTVGSENVTIDGNEANNRYFKYTGDPEICQYVLQIIAAQQSLSSVDLGISNKRVRSRSIPSTGRPLKKGWLYKKRDIINGWRLRYFVVYVGRLEYFTDQNAVVPRGVFPLYGAEIVGPKRCSVNGNDDHYSLTVEPRHKDKSLVLASDHRGEEGHVDTMSWIQAFTLGSKTMDNPTGLNGVLTPMKSPKVKSNQEKSARDTESINFNGLAKSLSFTTSTPNTSNTSSPDIADVEQNTKFIRRRNAAILAAITLIIAGFVGGGLYGVISAIILVLFSTAAIVNSILSDKKEKDKSS